MSIIGALFATQWCDPEPHSQAQGPWWVGDHPGNGNDTGLGWAQCLPWTLQLQRSLMTGQAACEQVSPLSLGVCQHSTTGTGQELE